LNYSFQKVERLSPRLAELNESDIESIEAFSSRFARTVDLLVNKVLRALDRVELLPQGTLLDVINRAEKRGFVRRAAELREMKDVRNIIAHDYAGAQAGEVFDYCRQQKLLLDSICDQVASYATPLLSSS
jgi:hypothetical protein